MCINTDDRKKVLRSQSLPLPPARSCLSPKIASKKCSNQKKVSFGEDCCKEIDFANYEKSNIWWTRIELEQNNDAHRRAVMEFKTEQDMFAETIITLYRECAKFRSISQILRSERAKHVIDNGSEIRGLENRLTKTMSHLRSQHVRNLLDQKDCSEEALRERSMQLSRTSSLFARVMAHSDAREALQCQ